MWGFSLDDIAKAASEQLSSGVGSVSTPSSLFNLDSMQQDQENEETQQKIHDSQDVVSGNGSSAGSVAKNLGDQFNAVWQNAASRNSSDLKPLTSTISRQRPKNLNSIDVDILLNTKTPPKPKPVLNVPQVSSNSDDDNLKSKTISPSPKGMWGSVLSNESSKGEKSVNKDFAGAMIEVSTNSTDDSEVKKDEDLSEGDIDTQENKDTKVEILAEMQSIENLNYVCQQDKNIHKHNINDVGDDKELDLALESNMDNDIVSSQSASSDDRMASEIQKLDIESKQITRDCDKNYSVIDENSNDVVNKDIASENSNDIVISHDNSGWHDDDFELNVASEHDENDNDKESSTIYNEVTNGSSSYDKGECINSKNESIESMDSINDEENEVSDTDQIKSLRNTIERLSSKYENDLMELKHKYEEKLKASEGKRNDQVKALQNDNNILQKQVENAGSKLAMMEKRAKIHQNESTSSKKHFEEAAGTIEALRSALATAQEDHATLNQQYDALKERVQSVAVELKERRVECRDLTAKNLDLARESSENEAKVYELRSENDRLKSLNSKLKDENQGLSANQGGHSSEMMKLQSLNVELENKVQELRTSLEDSDKKANIFAQEAMSLRCSLDEKIKAAKEESEEILDSYKRKAQAALASANARATAAIQDREGAEEAAARARELIEDAKHSKENFLLLENQIKSELDVANSKCKELESIIRQKDDAMRSAEKDLIKMRDAFSSIQEEKATIKSNLNVLEREQIQLKLRLKKSEQDLENEICQASKLRQRLEDNENVLQNTSTDNANSTSTIARLRSELKEANDDIEELKDALKSALLQKQALEEVQTVSISSEQKPEPSRHSSRENSDTGNTTPLFYAMEKQAELSAARDEISRLASLLGDANQAKEEALSEAEEARKKLEETETMLLRQIKMGKPNKGNVPETLNNNDKGTYEHMSKVESAADINLEYLKNIMLKYLSATSYSERKSLIPAISAVLCLTRDETQQAINSVDLSAGIGNALMDSFSKFRSPSTK